MNKATVKALRTARYVYLSFFTNDVPGASRDETVQVQFVVWCGVV